MAIIDVVRFNGLRSRDWLIYKFPSEELVTGAQLIVQEGQNAIFVKGGQIADIFTPGTYTLTTANLPILKKFVNLSFGGQTPFSAEVYFVNTALKLDINWGTPDAVQLVDPKYNVRIRIRGFGRMGLRVISVDKMFKEIIGGMQKRDIVNFERLTDYFRGLLVTKVKNLIVNTIITNKISALEIGAELEKLSDIMKEKLSPSFREYGFEVINFFIQSINFPDEDFENINKILEKKAEFDLLGERRYIAKRSFDVYEGAANNTGGAAGAFAAGGMGFGMGAAMGQGMG